MGLTRQELADKVGVHYQTIGYLEREEYSPSLVLALRISKVLDQEISDLFSLSRGALGVFVASVIPFVDAIAMVPVGIALGVNPTLAVIAAVVGDAIAIVVFAYLSSTMRNRIIKRRAAKGKTGESPKFEKAIRMFDKYGIYGMAIAAPALIGTQIAAMASVAAGVKPFRASTLIIASTLIWSAGIAIAMVVFDVRLDLS